MTRSIQATAIPRESLPPFHPGELVRYRPAKHVERVERAVSIGSDNRITWHVLTSWHRGRSRWAPAGMFEQVRTPDR